MRQKLIYTLIALGLAFMLATSFQSRLTTHWYFTWLGGFTVVTWAFYGLGKNIAEFKRLKRWRVPELTLNLLALLGGVAGAWVGRAMFNHKTNIKKHPVIFAVLVISTLSHIYMIIRVLYGPPLLWWPPENWFSFG